MPATLEVMSLWAVIMGSTGTSRHAVANKKSHTVPFRFTYG